MDSVEAKLDAILASNAKILAAVQRLEPGVANMDGHVHWVENVLHTAYQKPLWALTHASSLLTGTPLLRSTDPRTTPEARDARHETRDVRGQ